MFNVFIPYTEDDFKAMREEKEFQKDMDLMIRWSEMFTNYVEKRDFENAKRAAKIMYQLADLYG